MHSLRSRRDVRGAGRPNPRPHREGLQRATARSRAHPRRHQQRPLRRSGAAPGHSGLSHGGGQPLLRLRVPEEGNRRIIDHVSRPPFALYRSQPRKSAARRIRRRNNLRHRQSDPTKCMRHFAGRRSTHPRSSSSTVTRPWKYFLVTLHRAENVDVENSAFAARSKPRQAALEVSVPRACARSTRARVRSTPNSDIDARPGLRPAVLRAVGLLRLCSAGASAFSCTIRQRHRSGGSLHPPRAQRDASRRHRAPRKRLSAAPMCWRAATPIQSCCS